MPYHNMPQSMWGRMDKCVSDVQGKGNDKKKAIAICYTSLMKGKELGEALKSFSLKAAPHYRATEKASDKASDYLVVEDPKEPSKWHLQVKKDGAPDHTLMGAAWAALHGGYRGNKYEGPNKAEAIAKLKKLYEDEKMPVPSEKSIMDAPNLRGDSIQSCVNCKYAMPIITEDGLMDIAMPMDAATMMQAKQSGGITLVCTQYEFEAEPSWVCDSWEAMPMPVAGDAVGKAADDAELTDAELWAIDRLYLDVRAGKVVLAPLEETDKAMVNPPHSGTPGGGLPGGGSPGRTSGKHQKCYMHLKKLGMDDDEARRVCRDALNSSAQKETADDNNPLEADWSIFKQKDGRYRWVMFTSSSYQDNDNEIVSQLAHEKDSARMNETGDFGVLDWWHLYVHNGELMRFRDLTAKELMESTPVQLGKCDFSAMHGRISVESGLFDDEFIAEKLSDKQSELGASREFFHSFRDPDEQGVYHDIHTYSRALLPRERASNRLTRLYVAKENEMLKDRIKDLTNKLGGDKKAEDKTAELLQAAETMDKAAQEARLASKETQAPAGTEAPPAPPETKEKETPILEQPGMFMADMKPEEFDAHVAKAATEILAPIVKEIGDMMKQLGETQASAMKESGVAITKQFETITQAQSALDKRLKELEGLTPRGYRPSQDPGTKISKEKAEALAPKPDEKQPASLSAWVAEPVAQSPVPQ